jgi:SAM-dependent methyltransferase
MSKIITQTFKDSFIEKFIYRRNIISIILKFVSTVLLFFLNCIVIFLFKISSFVGWFYTKIWPFLNVSSYDHRFDFLRGIENYGWYERGILARNKIEKGDSVLDIGCGDGIYSGIFYSAKAAKVEAIDIDGKAIKHAKKYYSKRNVKYIEVGVVDWLKAKRKYNAIFMFAVIEHFEPQDGLQILKSVKRSLTKDGIFFGSTPLIKNKSAYNFEHKNEFDSAAALVKFLLKVFSKVDIYVSEWPGNRSDCYFECKN